MGRVRVPVCAFLAAVLFVACTAGRETAPPTGGGTLRVLFLSAGGDTAGWDPLETTGGVQWEVLRCCLLRRLYSYNGLPAEEGGAVVRPDLAARMPAVSPDGLTWTIAMKEGLRYAPPYAGREIVSGDVVEAIQRMARDEAYWSQYFEPVLGFDEYANDDADRIRGLAAPDVHTLVLRLAEPVGDLPDRLAIPAAAPMPPRAADGHEDDYIRYLIASGPYMLEGSERLTPWLPLGRQRPVSGFGDHEIVLVRNPSWNPSTDELRPAIPDEIRLEMRDTVTRGFRALAAGRLDVVAYASRREIRRVERGNLPGWIVAGPMSEVQYLPFNLAVAPFDDVHVRRAVNLALNRVALGRAVSAGTRAVPLWHLVPGALEGNRIEDGRPPTWAAGAPATGDLAMARAEMRRSHYDRDGDGRCDGPRCIVKSVAGMGTKRNTERITRTLSQLGIALRIRDPSAGWYAAQEPGRRFGFTFENGWQADYANASTFFVPLLYGPSIKEGSNLNQALLGADRADLHRWGYTVSAVESVDRRIERCLGYGGDAQTDCWASLDQYLMEEIVPWAPYATFDDAFVVSSSVLDAPFDASLDCLAFDRIALGSEAR